MSENEVKKCPQKKSVWRWLRGIIGFISGLPIVAVAVIGICAFIQEGFEQANCRHWEMTAFFVFPGVCAFLGFVLSFFERSRFSRTTGIVQIVVAILAIASFAGAILYERFRGYPWLLGDGNPDESFQIGLLVLWMLVILPMIFVILSGVCAIRNAKRI